MLSFDGETYLILRVINIHRIFLEYGLTQHYPTIKCLLYIQRDFLMLIRSHQILQRNHDTRTLKFKIQILVEQTLNFIFTGRGGALNKEGALIDLACRYFTQSLNHKLLNDLLREADIR
jgi:hypothetical protein